MGHIEMQYIIDLGKCCIWNNAHNWNNRKKEE